MVNKWIKVSFEAKSYYLFNKINHLFSMISSFVELNSFWASNYFNPNVLVIKSNNPSTRSNFFLDLIINEAFDNKVYICCSSRYLLKDKITSLNLPCINNIYFIENKDDINLNINATFFFYEPNQFWMSSIQKLAFNNKKVIIDYNKRELLDVSTTCYFQEIELNEDKEVFSFKIKNNNMDEITNFKIMRPKKYQQFSYFLESPNLRNLFELFFQQKFDTNQIVIKNYFPELFNIFSYGLKTLLAKKGIKSNKFFNKLIEKSLYKEKNHLVINCIYINFCLNLMKDNNSFKIDNLYKLLECDLNNVTQRRPVYDFFKYFKEDSIIRIIKRTKERDFYYLETIELDFGILKVNDAEMLNFKPNRLRDIKEIKEYTSSITFRYRENQKYPENIFMSLNDDVIFAPRDYYELYELKILFKNCVSVYSNDISMGKIIILKITHKDVPICVALDGKYNIRSAKLSENKEVSKEQYEFVKKSIKKIVKSKISINDYFLFILNKFRL